MRDIFVFTMITKARLWRHIYHDIEVPRPKNHDIEIARPKSHDIEIPRPKNHGTIALSYPPRVRATVKLSAAFFHESHQ